MTTRAVLRGVLVAGAAASVWLLLGDAADPGARDVGVRPSARSQPVERPAVLPSSEHLPPPARAESEPQRAAQPPTARAESPASEPAFLYPEQLELEHAYWDRVPARDVLLDIGRQARLRIVLSDSVERLLAETPVSLELQDTTGSVVLSRVLVPLGLSYTLSDGRIRVFVDDD